MMKDVKLRRFVNLGSKKRRSRRSYKIYYFNRDNKNAKSRSRKPRKFANEKLQYSQAEGWMVTGNDSTCLE